MKAKLFKITLFTLACSFLLVSASPDTERQYKIKAGFLYKFLMFAQWPKQAFEHSEKTVIIGILGENPFGDSFEMVEGTPINGRKLVIAYYAPDTGFDRLRRCHLLFISYSMENSYKDILEGLKEYPVLTVSEIDGFAASGGMIHFIMDRNNVTFTINNAAAIKAGIRIRSKLLRLAADVIKETERGPS